MLQPIFLILLVCILLSTSAQAARPLVTDDARITAQGSCQVETWLQGYRDSTEYWLMPSCGLTDWLEIGAASSWLYENNGSAHDSTLLQLKGLFKALPEDGGWGAGLVVGARSGQGASNDYLGSSYIYAPISIIPVEGIAVHFNPGWQRLKIDDHYWQSWTWGVGTEINLIPRIQGIAETFGDDQASYYQGGLRLWIIPERVQLDMTYGNRFSGGDEAWWSLGLRLISGQFF